MIHRRDIDGLRAIAIVSVVLYHAFPHMIPGGFLGVDVFFVISGFLITKIIFREFAEGSFSYTGFYLRRARRLLPALATVLACVAFVSWFLLWPSEYAAMAKHLLASVFFLGNISLLQESGYFDASADTKPLLHLWSLGVEAQYYLPWPALVAFVMHRSCVLPVFMGVILLSFILGACMVHSHPDSVFYLPLTRYWELATGGLLAGLMDTSWWRIRPLHADIASLVGLVILLLAFFLLAPDPTLRGWFAYLWPVIASMLIIGSGPQAWINRVALAARLPVYLGAISYPWYLWHWPVFSLALLAGNGHPGTIAMIALAMISLLLAQLTWVYVERPLQRRWSRQILFCLTGGMLLLALWAGIAWKRQGFPMRMPDAPTPVTLSAEQPMMLPVAGWSSHCPLGLTVDAETACLSSNDDRHQPRILLLGDSHAMAFALGLAAAMDAGQHAPGLEALSKGGGCMPFPAIEKRASAGRCQPFFGEVLHYASQQSAAGTVVLMARWARAFSGEGFGIDRAKMRRQFHDPRKPDDAQAGLATLFEDGLAETLQLLTEAGKKVIFIHQVPELGFDPVSCMPRPYGIAGGRTSCSVTRVAVEARQRDYRAAVSRVLARFPEVETLDPVSYFCDTQVCHARLDGGDLAYTDDDHLSVAGARHLAMGLLGKVADER